MSARIADQNSSRPHSNLKKLNPELDWLTWFRRVTTDQDKQIMDDNQAGVNSLAYQSSPYLETEPRLNLFTNQRLAQITTRATAKAPTQTH